MARSSEPRTEQLVLLAPAGVPDRLRLDVRTRRIGLAGVRAARQILDEQARRRAERDAADHPPFTRRAA